jgi:hypothetical protein
MEGSPTPRATSANLPSLLAAAIKAENAQECVRGLARSLARAARGNCRRTAFVVELPGNVGPVQGLPKPRMPHPPLPARSLGRRINKWTGIAGLVDGVWGLLGIVLAWSGDPLWGWLRPAGLRAARSVLQPA